MPIISPETVVVSVWSNFMEAVVLTTNAVKADKDCDKTALRDSVKGAIKSAEKGIIEAKMILRQIDS